MKFLGIFFCLCLNAPAFAQNNVPLEPITVSPGIDKQNAPLVRALGSTEYIEQEDLKKQVTTTLRDTLKGSSNVEFTGGPRAEAQLPQIRGLNSDRILILEDGVRQNFSSGHNGRAFGDYSLMESVELVKGPWSSLYGSGAMGGAISFRRSTAADFIRRTGKAQGLEAALDSDSATDGFGQRLTGFSKAGGFEPLLSFRQSNSHDVRLGDGRHLDYSSSQTYDYYSSLGFRVSEKQNFTLKLNRFEDRSNTPLEPEGEISALNEAAKYLSLKQDAVGEYNLSGEMWDFHTKPYFRQTSIQKTRVRDGRVDKQIVDTAGIDAWSNWRFTFNTSNKAVLTTGAEFYHDHNDGQRNSSGLASFPDGKSEQLGVYVQPTLTLGKLSLTPGARFDSYKLEDSSNISKANRDDNFSLKAYADYEYLSERHLFLGWGQAFNAPRLQDLYVSGMHFPGNFFQPNPNLKPERAETFEAGSKNNFHIGVDETLAVNATYFVTEAKDFIAREVDIPGGSTQFKNVNRVRLNGIEASLNYNRALWGAGLSYGQTRSLNKGSGEALADTAADQVAMTVQFYPSDFLSVGTQLRQAFSQNRVPTGTNPSPGYFVEDFFVTYKPGRWDMRLRLDNAFDRDYRSHTSAIKSTGRDLRVTVGYLF